MFTGIIEQIGKIEDISQTGRDSVAVTVHAPLAVSDAETGQSIAIDGVCLTVIDVRGESFVADVMKETLDRSTLGRLSPGDPVNVERAMRADARLGGHIVQGHVDTVATLLTREPAEKWEILTFGFPPEIAPYLVEKGSITVSGVSLTITRVSEAADPEPSFSVSLIPETLERTVLGRLAPGGQVNLEVDVIGKYVARILSFESRTRHASESDGSAPAAEPNTIEEGAQHAR